MKNFFRSTSGIIGFVLLVPNGTILAIMEVVWFYQHWGPMGAIIGGVLFPPIVTLFPFIAWVVDRSFPWLYAAFWAAGVLGAFLLALSDKDHPPGSASSAKRALP